MFTVQSVIKNLQDSKLIYYTKLFRKCEAIIYSIGGQDLR